MKNNSVFNSENYKAFYTSITSNKDLATKLRNMIDDYKVSVDDKQALVEGCMNAVAKHQYVRDSVIDGNAMEILENALDNSGSTVYERLHHLHQMNFGLNLFDDEDATKSIVKDVNVKNLFEDYMKNVAEDPVSETELKSDIMKKMSHISLSPDCIIKYSEHINKHSDMLNSSIKLGKNSYETRCIVTMDEYLRGNYFDISLAALAVCQKAEIQTVSHALTTGSIFKERADAMLEPIAIILLITALVLGTFELYFAAIIVAIASFVLYVYPECISDHVHMYFAKRNYNELVEHVAENNNLDYDELEFNCDFDMCEENVECLYTPF